MSGFEYFIYKCIYELMTWLFEVCAIFPLWCFIVEIFNHVDWELFEDVTSISWIFVIFAYFYRFNRSKAFQVSIRAMLVLSGPKLGELAVCMWMVLSYLRYLLCCSCSVGCFFPLYATCTEVLSVLVLVFYFVRRVWAEWESSCIL